MGKARASIRVHDLRRQHGPDHQRGVIGMGKGRGIETVIIVETKIEIRFGTEEDGNDPIQGAK